MRVIGYCRVSTAKQTEEGLSLDAQRARIEAWCEAFGHDLVGMGMEEGVSGAVAPESRRAFRDVLARIPGDADAVVCTDLSRATRSLQHLVDLVESGLQLVSLSENLDTTTPTGRLIVHVLGSVNQWQREKIAEDSRAAAAYRRSQGKGVGRYTPFGWRYSDGTWDASAASPEARDEPMIQNEQEQRDLALVRGMRSEGVSPQGIADRLRQNPRTGRRFTRDEIRSILRSLES